MKKYSHCRIYPLLLLILITSACSTPPDATFIDKAKLQAEQLIELMASGNYQQAVKLYGPRFFERIDPQGWITILQRVPEKLGRYQSHKLTSSQVTHGFSTISTATTVLVYRIYYEKSYAIQKFTFTSDEKSENMVLVGHYIDFPKMEGEE